jgi:hypothetical protein
VKAGVSFRLIGVLKLLTKESQPTSTRTAHRGLATERLDGLLVERLLDAGLRVLALHPNQVAAARARFRVSGGKSDRSDAYVICELARTDHHRFRVLEPDSDQTKALRALTRAREDLVHTGGAG